jgi:PPP family 3-phenylpropionic acid transporter
VLVTGNAAATFGMVIAAVSKWTLAGTVVLRDSLDSPGASLLSQLTITRLKQQGRDIYGQLRAWGSLGWGVTTMFSGLLIGAGGYALLFITAASLSLLSLPFSRSLPSRTTDDNSDEKAQDTPTPPLKRQPGFYILMISWFFFYVGMSAVGGFMFVYFQHDLGANNTMIGILASVAALAEIPSMLLIDRMLRRVNIRLTLIIGMLGMAGLWVLFTLLNGTALLIPLMMVRGTFYTFQNVGSTLLVSRISHPANAATNQAISQVTVPALALLVTGPIAGWIFDHLGGPALFRTVALVTVLGVILLVAARRELAKTATTVQYFSQSATS